MQKWKLLTAVRLIPSPPAAGLFFCNLPAAWFALSHQPFGIPACMYSDNRQNLVQD